MCPGFIFSLLCRQCHNSFHLSHLRKQKVMSSRLHLQSHRMSALSSAVSNMICSLLSNLSKYFKIFSSFKAYYIAYLCIHSHADDYLMAFPCMMELASAVTIALGGVHSWAGVYSMCCDCWTSRQSKKPSSVRTLIQTRVENCPRTFIFSNWHEKQKSGRFGLWLYICTWCSIP